MQKSCISILKSNLDKQANVFMLKQFTSIVGYRWSAVSDSSVVAGIDWQTVRKQKGV